MSSVEILFLFTYRSFCSPMADSVSKKCVSEFSEKIESNILPIILFFVVEIAIIFGFFLQMSPKKKHRLMKTLFEDRFMLVKVSYYMSFQAIYESWLRFFLTAQNQIYLLRISLFFYFYWIFGKYLNTQKTLISCCAFN